MKNISMHCLFVRHGLPDYYPQYVARSLKPFCVGLVCHTDREDLPGEDNLFFRNIDPARVPSCIASHPQAWWHMLLFLDPSFCGDNRAVYVDVDSLFLQDPMPLMAMAPFHGLAFPRCYVGGAPLLLNAGMAVYDYEGAPDVFEGLWRQVVESPQLDGVVGPQTWLQEHVKGWFMLPDPYYVSFLHWFGHRPRFKFYSEHARVREEDILAFSFMSRPKLEGVLAQGMHGAGFLLERFPWLSEMSTRPT